MTATAGGMAAGSSGRRALLQLTRASYGVALVVAPRLMTYLATGRFPGRRGRRVAQLLGARHLAQAAITAFVPVPETFALGAGVDAVHAGSMLVLAVADPVARHAALTDAAAEAVFAAAGCSAAAAAQCPAEAAGSSAPVQAPEADLLQQQP